VLSDVPVLLLDVIVNRGLRFLLLNALTSLCTQIR